MAYDYTKSLLPQVYLAKLQNHPLLDFKLKVSRKTGLLSKKEVAKYKGLTFTIRSNRIWLSGSLHYFYNYYFKNENQNFNDFTFEKLLVILDEIESLFDIDLSKCRLENLEIGVNTLLPFKVSLILTNLLYHITKPFKNKEVNRGNGDYRVVIHDRYILKFYDKGLQFGLPDELMRFEIHYKKMCDLKKFGIVYLSDLRNKAKLECLKIELLKRFDEVFLYDWTISENMIKRKPKDFYKWRVCQHWIVELNKSNRIKRKSVYNDFVNSYSNSIKKQTRGLIEHKINELIHNKKLPFHSRE